ncbi:MAG: hypothetical protein LBQ83_01385 [Candidatus Margulisbacteria bacterium]|jgi:hypothetical protein|nr:hypothetical protein [Candidatus Margulisiibacteriota bacterium]
MTRVLYTAIQQGQRITAQDITNALNAKVNLDGPDDYPIDGQKTFALSPVVPAKSTAAGNNATYIATEAQVYLVNSALSTAITNAAAGLTTKVNKGTSAADGVNETIYGTKTFDTSPVVPAKNTAAGNNSTVIATEAQVYKASLWQ